MLTNFHQYLCQTVLALVCLAFNAQAKPGVPGAVEQKRITARLAASSPLIDPALLETRGSSDDYSALLSDPALVTFTKENFNPAGKESADIFEPQQAGERNSPPKLTRFGGFLALTGAFNARPLNANGEKQLWEIRQRWEHVLDNQSYRTNCYSFAVGDNTSNQLLVMASPGQRVSGQEFDPTYYHSDVLRSAIKGGLVFAGRDPAKLQIPPGQRVVMMYHMVGHDYHWVRLDRTADGKLAASSKFGVEPDIRHWPVHNIYNEIKRTYAEPGASGYTFRAFFLIPEDGIDVGLDAYYKSKGELPMPPDWRKTSPQTAREQDSFILNKAFSHE